METCSGGPGAKRWSWQCLLAVLIALTPLLAAAPGAHALPSGSTGSGASGTAASAPRSPPVQPVDITVDGRPLPSPGTVDQGTTLAPVGTLVRALGGSVVQALPTAARIQLGGHVLTAQAAQATMDIDGHSQAVSVAPEVIQGELYIPVRPLVSVMGYALDWLGETATVAISTRPALPVPSAAPQRLVPPTPAPDERPAAQPAPVVPYTAADLELMGRVIHGEADDQPLSARIGIGAVIVNRVRAPGFPKTIAGVIYAPGQFQAVGAPMFEAGPTASDLEAAHDALDGQDPTGGALFFYVPALTDPGSWIFSTHTLVTLGVVRFST